MTQSEKLVYYRKKQQLSQEHLAKLSHLNISTIRKYESEDRKPSQKQLEKLANALNINVAALKNYQLDNVTDYINVIWELIKNIGIEFKGEKNENGQYIGNTLFFRFKNEELMGLLSVLAKTGETITTIQDTLDKTDDSDYINSLEEIIKLKTEKTEDYLSQYSCSDIIDYAKYSFTPKKDYNYKNTISLKKAIQKLHDSAIDIEFVPVWERAFENKLIATIRTSSIINPEDQMIFGEYLYVCYLLKDALYRISTYNYIENNQEYYRIIIYDKEITHWYRKQYHND